MSAYFELDIIDFIFNKRSDRYQGFDLLRQFAAANCSFLRTEASIVN